MIQRITTNTLLLLLLLYIAICCCCRQDKPQDFITETTATAIATVGNDTLHISLDRISDTFNVVRVKTLKGGKPVHASAFPLPYPVYRFDIGDVTGNGVPDIAVGVIKTTKYDPKLAKRPFLLKINEDGDVRRLWMGSRVSQPLEDFALSKNETPAKVFTIERERSGKFLVAVYRYRGFGLEHNGYIKREISLKEAYKLLQKVVR